MCEALHSTSTEEIPLIKGDLKTSPLHQVLLGPDDAVLSDELNHASIIDGIRLCRAKRLRYKHMDLSDLETKLKESQVCVGTSLFGQPEPSFTRNMYHGCVFCSSVT